VLSRFNRSATSSELGQQRRETFVRFWSEPAFSGR
jgi:hypothetical protein